MLVRAMRFTDLEAAASLMGELGYPVSTAEFTERFAAVSSNPGDAVLVAEEEGRVIGLISLHSFAMLHRPGRMGRITALVVSEMARGRGTGKSLLAAAEEQLRNAGCTHIEVTSNDRRTGAHAFYGSKGYKEKRMRFVKS